MHKVLQEIQSAVSTKSRTASVIDIGEVNKKVSNALRG